MKLWIARDKNKNLYLYPLKPEKIKERGFFRPVYNSGYLTFIKMDKKEFPEVTWENSPQQVEINLIK